jgi:hypothetical protein
MIVVGILLIVVGIAFALTKSRGAEAAGLQAFKINVTGQAWLILIVLGVGILGAVWWFDFDHANVKDPAGDVPVTVTPEADFDESTPEEPYTFGEDGDLDELWLACEAGAMQACDDLYQDSPVGSEYELMGATCGFRFDDPPEFCVDAPMSAVG